MLIIGKYGRPRGIILSNVLILILNATSLLGPYTSLHLRLRTVSVPNVTKLD